MEILKCSEVNVVTPTYDDMDFVKLVDKEMAKVENMSVSYKYYLSCLIT